MKRRTELSTLSADTDTVHSLPPCRKQTHLLFQPTLCRGKTMHGLFQPYPLYDSAVTVHPVHAPYMSSNRIIPLKC